MLARMNRTTAIASSLLFLALACAIPIAQGCSAAQKQTETQLIEEGCTLVAILDPAGQTAATICEKAAPSVVDAVDAVVKQLSGKMGATVPGPAKFVPLVVEGRTQGYVRAELVDAIHAKLAEKAAAKK
jgi:hypothetical protein